MSITAIVIISLAIGSIVGGLLILIKSSGKFTLTPEELAKVKQRNKALTKEEESQD